MRHTARGIILKDQHVLLVIGHGASFYWTPGGGVDHGESVIQTLHRELKEELGVDIETCVPYYSYTYEDQKVDSFLVTIGGEIRIGEEITGYTWYSSSSRVRPSDGFMKMLMPRLVEEGLVA